MTVQKLKKLGLVIRVSAFSCFLLLQGSFAVSSISPSSSVAPAFSPNAEETTGQISNSKTFPSDGPSSTSEPNGTMSHLPVAPRPLNSFPGPQMNAPNFLPNAPPSLPPSSRIIPASSPSNDQLTRPQSPEHSVVRPQTPGPVASPSRQSPQKSPIFESPMNLPVPIDPNKNSSSINLPNVQLAPAPSTFPDTLPPAPTLPNKLPSNASDSSMSPYSDVVPALAPTAKTITGHIFNGKSFTCAPPFSASQQNGLFSGKYGKRVAAPMVRPGDHHLPVNPSPAYAPRPGINKNHSSSNAPSAQKGKEDVNAPPPLSYQNRAPKFGSEPPVAVPSTTTQRHHYPMYMTTAPAPAPASTVKEVPPPLSYPVFAPNFLPEPPASVPSATTQRHHYPIDRTIAPSSPVSGVPPPLSHPISAPHSRLQPPSSFPSTTTQRHRHAKDKPISPTAPINGVPDASPIQDNYYSPAPSPIQTTTVPLPLPEAPHARSLPTFPKMPVQLLPPPPPDEDCAALTCSMPLTNGPPGPPCLCVLPILVGLRLSVELYTFFPLVAELAVEISAGFLLKQSQVRVMGANEATQDSGKTIVLIELVPLGKKFDRTSAYMIFQRFWQKQVDIKASLFGDYEVLYVRYPGLPPSPPAASPDIDAIYNDPYHNHDNNSRSMKPLGVDVSRIRHDKGLNRSLIAVIVLSALLALILSCVLVWVFLFKNRGSISGPERIAPGAVVPSLAKSSGGLESVVESGRSSASVSLGPGIPAYTGSAKTFSSSEIERATSNFDEMGVLGEGGFGKVYSGVLDDGTEVAVKVLKRDDLQGGREFLAEVEMLSRLHHRNLVKLIGICSEERARSLVYELVPNGSVESHLHGVDKGNAPLDWSARLKIALGAARGLAYLHEDSSPRVIHRDFKASNILLEHDFTAKVSDFGLARTALDDNRHISTRVMGTFGYVAPEYAMTGHLLVKSDVYSYGVVLLELLTGRKPVDMTQPAGQENLVSFARPLLTSKEGLELIVDQSLRPNISFDSISKVAAIASMCVEPEVSNRPFMGEVVQALKFVCNECEELKIATRRCSQEDISIDMGARMSTNSEVSRHDHQIDVGNVHSVSELLSSSIRSGRIENDSLRMHSSSGPLRSMNTSRLLQHIRRLSGGSISKHGMIYRPRPGSN